MITIQQNASNNVVATLNEKATVTPFDVLFEFKNDSSGDIKYFTALDISPATARYNRFTIVENTTENLYAGIVSLEPAGYWSYKIYEMPVASPPSIDPLNAIGILEEGKVLVKPNSITPTPTFNADEDIDSTIFTVDENEF